MSDHCNYVVPRKKRRCRMLIKPGAFYCGEHEHLLENDPKLPKNEEIETGRIPCPLDPNHSVTKTKLESHLKKCPARQDNVPDYIVKGINLPKNEESVQGLTISTASDDELLNVISKVNKIYDETIRDKIKTRILKHPIVEEEINQEHIGASAAKHLIQNSCLLAHLENMKVFEAENARLVEFGSGRGQLTYWMAKASKTKQKFLLVDKASHRHKFDNKLKDEDLNITRIRADIQDLSLSKVGQILEDPIGPLIGVSKHLCGAATDLALRSLATFSIQPDATSCKIQAILVALCCHHRCQWNVYVGKNYLLGQGFKQEEFNLLCGLTSWATCGSGKPRAKKKAKIEEESKEPDRYEKLDLPREKREEIGRRTKRLLDFGRCDFVKRECGLDYAELVYYAEQGCTLENVMLIAGNK